MVSCDRCHRRFSSYAALEQHHSTKHPGSRMPAHLQSQLVDERRLESRYKPTTFTHKSSRTKLAVFVLVLITAAVVIGVVALKSPGSGERAVRAGSVAPEFSLPDTAGGTFRLSDYRGTSNVLLFFNEGLACSPCLQQMQGLDQLNQQLTGMGIVVASITTDRVDQLSGWTQVGGPRYGRVLSDQSLTVSRAYDMLGSSMHPGLVDGHSFVLINKSGVVLWRQDYYPPSMYVQSDQLLADIRRAMGA